MNFIKIFFISLIILASMSIIICNAIDDIAENLTILEAIEDSNLTTFSAALDKAGLTKALDNKGLLVMGKGSFIVFAPIDEAFANSMDIDIEPMMENETELKSLLANHIIWNDGSFDNITDISNPQTLEGQNLSIDIKDGLTVNGAKVLESLYFDNGIIYVIDQVILPHEPASGMGIAEVDKRLGLMKFDHAINSAGFVERLNGRGLLGIESTREGPFTIFAPSDEAFSNIPAETLREINSRENGMIMLLSYHIIESKALQNLTNVSSLKTLEGSSLGVDPENNLIGGANVIGSGIYDNGIIYIIDRMLIPLKLSI